MGASHIQIASVDGPSVRRCRACDTVKSADAFCAAKPHRCKECHAAKRREYVAANRDDVNAKKRAALKSEAGKRARAAWREKNRENISAFNREDYRRHYVARALYNASVRAAKCGVPFDLVAADIFVPEFCPVLGIRLEIGTRGFSPNSPSIDRIVPELGYVPGNIAVISLRANKIKSDATADELERVASWCRSLAPRPPL